MQKLPILGFSLISVLGCVVLIKYPLWGIVLILVVLAVYWCQRPRPADKLLDAAPPNVTEPNVTDTPLSAAPSTIGTQPGTQPPSPISTGTPPSPTSSNTPLPTDTLPPTLPSTLPPLSTTTSSILPDLDECPFSPPKTSPRAQKIVPANTMDSVVNSEDAITHPALMDKQCINEWFPTASFKDQQESEYKLHRAARRNQDWAATARWTDADKAKYERARQAQEKSIALALRPDAYMVVERAPDTDYSADSTQPFATLTAQDAQFFHVNRFHTMMGDGDMCQALQTKI